MQLNFIVCALLMFASMTVIAENEHQDNHRELGAHEHGTGTLNLVMEGKTLKVYLEAPLMNVVGFEHKPTNQAEQNQLDIALKQFKNPKTMLILSNGDCQLSNTEISNPFVNKTDHQQQESGSDEHIHSDIDVEYSFICHKPSELNTINISLFDSFSGFKSLRAQWIIQSMSGGGKFDHDQHLLKVR